MKLLLESNDMDESRINKVVKWSCAFILVGLVTYAAIGMSYNRRPTIYSDGFGYHAWVHAIKDMDLSFWKFKEMHLNPDEGNTNLFGVWQQRFSKDVDVNNNRIRNRLPPGVGMMQFLFFGWLGTYDSETNTYSLFSHRAAAVSAAVMFLLATFLLYRIMRNIGIDTIRSIIALASFIFGSGLFHYAIFDASFSHIYSTFGASAMLYIVIMNREKNLSKWNIALFAILSWWMILVRATNVALTFSIIFLFWIIKNAQFDDPKSTFVRLRSILKPRPQCTPLGLSWLIGTGVAFVLMCLYNYYSVGIFTISTYGAIERIFPVFAKHSLDVFASYERGLATYYPIFIPTIILSLIYCKNPIKYIFYFLICFYVLLYGTWANWYLGAGFGHRGFIEITPFGIIVLGLCLQQVKKVKTLIIYTCLLFLCCAITMRFMYAYWRGKYPSAHSTADIFWAQLLPNDAVSEALKLRYWSFINDVEVPTTAIQELTTNYNPGSLKRMIDRKFSTRWTSKAPQKEDMFVRIKFDSLMQLNGLYLQVPHTNRRHDPPKNADLFYSIDGEHWSNVNIIRHSDVFFIFEPIVCNYFEIRQTGAKKRVWWSIHELYLYGKPVLPDHENVVSNQGSNDRGN